MAGRYGTTFAINAFFSAEVQSWMKTAVSQNSFPTTGLNTPMACIASVIVCTKERPAELQRFIDSLNGQTRPADELILVDASRDDRTQEMARRFSGGAAYPIIYLRTKPGLTRQRNIGVRVAAGRYLFFFDDDVILSRHYVEFVLDAFERSTPPMLGGVTGRIVNLPHMDLATRLCQKLFMLSDCGGGKLKQSGFPSMACGPRPVRVFVLPGCSVYSRAVFDRYAFDENLVDYGYMEDVDFSSRVSREFRLLYCPEAEFEHHPSTFRKYGAAALREMMVRHHVYLYRKNSPKTPVHVAAFIWSLLGILICNALLSRDMEACRGILRGLFRR